MLIDRDARRLEAAGVSIPRKSDGSADAKIEISPAAVLDEDDAKAYVAAHRIARIEPGSEIFLK